MVASTNNAAGAGNITQLVGAKGMLSGMNGKQDFRAFYDEAGVGLLAKLEANIGGAGFKEANLVIAQELGGTALEGKMFVLSNR